MTTLHALTISQPYASLIADGKKWVENRGWSTPHRGPLAIHAGKGTQYLSSDQLHAYPAGCIVAVAFVCDCMPIHLLRSSLDKSTEATRDRLQRILEHEHTEGPFCWIFQRVLKLSHPVPAIGKQGIWQVPEHVAVLCRNAGWEVTYNA
jgi:hypothetical protein